MRGSLNQKTTERTREGGSPRLQEFALTLLSHALTVGLGISFSVSFSACITKKKGFEVPVAEFIEIIKIQGETVENWRVDADDKIYIRSRTLDILAKCDPRKRYAIGVEVVGQTGIFVSNEKCTSDRSVTFTYLFANDGEANITIASLDDDSEKDNFKGTIVIDTVPPNAPVITTNSGNDIQGENPNVLIEGTIDSDVVLVDSGGLGPVEVSQPAGTFSFTTNLSWGQTLNHTFIAEDFAGNRSPLDSIKVSYYSTTSIETAAFPSFAAEGVLTGSATNLTAVSGESLTGSTSSQSAVLSLNKGFTTRAGEVDP